MPLGNGSREGGWRSWGRSWANGTIGGGETKVVSVSPRGGLILGGGEEKSTPRNRRTLRP